MRSQHQVPSASPSHAAAGHPSTATQPAPSDALDHDAAQAWTWTSTISAEVSVTSSQAPSIWEHTGNVATRSKNVGSGSPRSNSDAHMPAVTHFLDQAVGPQVSQVPQDLTRRGVESDGLAREDLGESLSDATARADASGVWRF